MKKVAPYLEPGVLSELVHKNGARKIRLLLLRLKTITKVKSRTLSRWKMTVLRGLRQVLGRKARSQRSPEKHPPRPSMKISFLIKTKNKRELMQMAQEKRKRPRKRRRSVPKSQTSM